MTREELNKYKQQEITNELKRENRKKITLFVFKMSGLLVLGFLLFYLYTTYVSTGLLLVKEERVVNSKLPSIFDGLKVIQFSDLHYGSTVFYDEVKDVVEEINKRKPDIVVFTGDLIDANYDLKTEEQEKLITLLKKIEVKLGKYAVTGEEDEEIFHTIMKQSDFFILENDYELIYNESSQPILLIGLSSKLNDDINIEEGFSYFTESTHNANIFTITLVHEPDTADKILSNYSTDLLLSGHSHNGNIRLPILGALYKYEGARKYDQEYYKIKDTDLYVSSGIGTNGPGFRLFCRPSINFFRISEK